MALPTIQAALAAVGATVFERGWLSANNILFQGDALTALVDSGYCTHAKQTLALVEHALGATPLDLLLNTHLHSDHCGGNAALQERYGRLQTLIPPGESNAVAAWNEDALTYRATGQTCPRFSAQGTLQAGQSIRLGSFDWEIHAAKGHDPHSVVLFQPNIRILISADALWENGFGVVFPELEGITAFDEVGETIDLIEKLSPLTIIPGHGTPFQDVKTAIYRARSRLEVFQRDPQRHLRHALKVLIKFHLLEHQQVSFEQLKAWTRTTPYTACAIPIEDGRANDWLLTLLQDLQKGGALLLLDDQIINT